MAFGISRTYLGGVLSHQRLIIRPSSSSSRLASCSTLLYPDIGFSTRAYSAASAALSKKRPVTAKGTRADAHLTPTPPKQKKVPSKKLTSPEMEKALQAADAAASSERLANEQRSKEVPMDEAEKLKDMERMMAFQHLMPTIDTWGQEIKETLDVMIPHNVKYTSPKLQTWNNASANFLNKVKNAAALSSLMSTDSLPGVHPPLGFRQQFRQIFKAFGTQSVEPDSVLAPIRRMAFDIYQELNQAVANRNDKDIRRYSTSSYQLQSLELAKKFRSKNPKGRMIWQLHRVIDPVQILSLRVTEGYLAPDEPRSGNRLMIHALVKFDTEQSLEMYSDRGVPFHTVVAEPDRIVDSEKPKEKWRVPAPRKRVTEYLVLEKKMWVVGPWQLREQMWPTVEEQEGGFSSIVSYP